MADRQDFESLLQDILPEAVLERHWQMEGGVSTVVWGLEIELRNGSREKLILRQEAAKGSSTSEFRLLKMLHDLGLAVPKVIHLESSAKNFPKPFILMEFIDGKADFSPVNLPAVIEQMLKTLVQTHRISLTQHDFSFLPAYIERLRNRLERPSLSDLESRIYDTIKSFFAEKANDRDVLLHGDYWAGNLLWNEGKLLAVIDWEDAALGDPLADLANARLELLWAYGLEPMQSFTEGYKEQMPQFDFTDLPYWDLFAVLRPMNQIANWGLEAEKLAKMQRDLAWFAEEAFRNLGMRG